MKKLFTLGLNFNCIGCLRKTSVMIEEQIFLDFFVIHTFVVNFKFCIVSYCFYLKCNSKIIILTLLCCDNVALP